MENFLYIILGAILTFLFNSYYQNKAVKNVEKKTEVSNKRINNLSVAALVNLANAILARRDSSNR